jgi:predicted metal-binding membrane protein
MAPALAPWSVMEFALGFAMWAVMMVGMMTPSAAPMILIYARVGRQAAIADKPFAATGWFAAGYMMTEAADNLRPWVICCSCETSAESQLLCSRPRPALKHRRGALSR